MKKVALLFGVLVFLGSCKDKIRQEYMANVPIYTDFETFRSVGGFEAAHPMTVKGNIYFKDDYLFILEPEEGIHFIDNANPASPVQTGFLRVWGATSVAIKGDYLYVNSLIDLVVYDVSSLSNPALVARVENVFPTALPISESSYPYELIDISKGVVTGWKQEKVSKDVTETYASPQWGGFNNNEQFLSNNIDASSNGSSPQVGVAGSISLFTIIGDYLYVMEEGNFLHPIDITIPNAPVAYEQVNVWAGVETLFPYKDYIFMGTPTGMFIYNTTNPRNPTYVSSLSHARGCDPVVVKDDFAYVTVRSNGSCGGDINQLDVIDVSTISNPTLLKSFSMHNPHGLGIDGNTLFICDGTAGLKVFDATDPLLVGSKLLHQFSTIQATDIIPFNNIAMVIGDDGIYQYDYSDPNQMVLLSKISF
jgi:hypothetical protein